MTAVAIASGEHAARSGHRLRGLRHEVSALGIGALHATAWHPRLQVVSATCDNVSLGGLCLRLVGMAHRSEEAQPDDRLNRLHVELFTGEVICHGDGLVRHLRVEGDDLLLGVQLLSGHVDLPTLFEKQARLRFAARCDEAEAIADVHRVLPEFKFWVSDLRSYLERMRFFLDREEAALQAEDRFSYEQICDQYLAEVAPRIVQRVHAASHRMGSLLGALTEEGHVVHRAYAQLHLGPIFSLSPFIKRALHKPLGYAGDYEMMNMLYRPHQEGSSLFVKVLNQCAATEVAAQANINRVGYLAGRLRQVLQASPGGARVPMASIGAGPGREIEALLEKEPSLGLLLDVLLVDQEPKAIQYCERRLSPVAARTGAQLHFVRESVRKLLCGGHVPTMLGSRHVIYSAGLFDYLSDRSFSALLGALYAALPVGGQLWIGNVDVSNPTRYFMEYFAEWFLIHRTRAQLLERARVLRPAPRSITVESEPLGVNLFLIVEK